MSALRVLQWLVLVLKMSFTISGDRLFNTLFISVARFWRFFSWTVTYLSLENILQMMRNDLYKQFFSPLMKFFMIYLSAMNYPD